MSENTEKESISGNGLTIPREVMVEMLAKNFDRLPEIDKKLFIYGNLYLGGNAAFAGLISNSLYRRALNISQGFIASSLPTAVLPFLVTAGLYNVLVSHTLLSGDLNCPTCAMTRGALVGVVGGGGYPILLALAVNIFLAAQLNTAPMPEKGNVLRHWVDVSRPILRQMRPVLLLQAFFGTYLGSRDFETYTKLARTTFGSGGEELKD
ncbi:transmembrane protein 126A-like [Lates japonicus]|uniref:Transmembrane protein 126A-like protein n=1 Tax=Lates japonicus TaxID=270547 RepID=A0AAD3MZQ2_LATJO|nr:transmembrane protein 126A-like protein [Lates japonicus]